MAESMCKLPTLLCYSFHTAAPMTFKRSRPTPLSLALTGKASLVDSESLFETQGLLIKNTFIVGESPVSPSLEGFYAERGVETCPARQMGRTADLLDESVTPDLEPWSLSPVKASTPLSSRSLATQTPDSPWSIQTPTIESFCLDSDMDISPLSSVDVGLGVCAPSTAPGVPLLSTSYGFWGMPPPAPCQAPKVVLSIVSALEPLPPPPAVPAPEVQGLASVGSALHLKGRCKPCAFLHTKGCSSGLSCKFCHLCEAGEGRKRAKEKREKIQQRRVRKALEAAPVVESEEPAAK